MGALDLPLIAENQSAAYVTSNDADAILESALCDQIPDHVATDAGVVVTAHQFRQNWHHRITGTPALAFDFVVPSIARPFMVSNDSGQTAGVRTAGGLSVPVLTGETRLLYCDGSAIVPLTDSLSAGAGGGGYQGALLSRSAATTIPLLPDNPSNPGTPIYVYTAIDWDSVAHDTDDFFDGTAGMESRITIPAGVSKVILSGQVTWDYNGTGWRLLRLQKGGGGSYAGQVSQSVKGDSATTQSFVSPVLSVIPGDYFELGVLQDAGVNINLPGSDKTWIGIHVIA
ncbi:hypothetical protein [Sneathiella chinensis]|uniref:Uncharacterized protein n=1 Tax=Sneathiella chinensis TaxID=349750 RepID=A0ABQ5U5U6_9PROT|nr:hypothetical protein [Sneathiella chinensis]GLQ07504.1 hypothetical protein GCM10007924_27250 [Sneathiella chinensis]